MDGWHHEGKIDWNGNIGWIRCEVERKEKKQLVKGVLFDFFHNFFGSREMMMTISFPLPVSCTSSSSSSSLLYRFSV